MIFYIHFYYMNESDHNKNKLMPFQRKEIWYKLLNERSRNKKKQLSKD